LDVTHSNARKSAVVVGACGGIGSATVNRLARDGWEVTGLDLPNPTARSNAVRMVPVDLADPASVDRAFKELGSHGRIDLLAMCSGVVDTEKIADTTLEHWQTMLAINLTGPFLCCRSAYPLLNEGGRIVLIGSLAGRTGGVLTGTAYAVAKGGLESLAKSMAQELAARRITVNVVAPGAIETPMVF
jgi:3-oxoacyl-[acyl-carrier protein] reductase